MPPGEPVSKAFSGGPCSSHRRWNSCPCGFHGDPKRQCRCTPQQVERYRERISGPLLDRIDLHVEAPAVAFDELRSTERSEPSAAIRERVIRARDAQRARFGDGSKVVSTPGCAAAPHCTTRRHRSLTVFTSKPGTP